MTEPADTREPLWIRFLEFPLIALLIAFATFMVASVVAYTILAYEGASSEAMRASAEASLNVGLLWVAYKLVIRHLGDKPHDDLPEASMLKLGMIGLAWGVLTFATVTGAAFVLGAYRVNGIGNASGLVTALASFSVLPGFREELLFRGIFLRWMEEFGGSWFGLILSAALFGLAHMFNPNVTPLSILSIAAFGLMVGGAYLATRSLWLPMGMHMAWNFTQGEILGVPVSGVDSNGLLVASLHGPQWLSGGAFGLEASIFTPIVCLIGAAWFIRQAVQRDLIFGPMWTRKGAIVIPDQRKL